MSFNQLSQVRAVSVGGFFETVNKHAPVAVTLLAVAATVSTIWGGFAALCAAAVVATIYGLFHRQIDQSIHSNPVLSATARCCLIPYVGFCGGVPWLGIAVILNVAIFLAEYTQNREELRALELANQQLAARNLQLSQAAQQHARLQASIQAAKNMAQSPAIVEQVSAVGRLEQTLGDLNTRLAQQNQRLAERINADAAHAQAFGESQQTVTTLIAQLQVALVRAHGAVDGEY